MESRRQLALDTDIVLLRLAEHAENNNAPLSDTLVKLQQIMAVNPARIWLNVLTASPKPNSGNSKTNQLYSDGFKQGVAWGSYGVSMAVERRINMSSPEVAASSPLFYDSIKTGALYSDVVESYCDRQYAQLPKHHHQLHEWAAQADFQGMTTVYFARGYSLAVGLGRDIVRMQTVGDFTQFMESHGMKDSEA